ncbi:hypothetical protein [Bradyrhizobium sp. WYCCWR 12699]|uniref:hypothetical protein n=1 Tax=Bradyrhizobium sp. WYCCWR 12699 TaxID=3064203 RepID=UPI0028A43A3B|nr:hypothetical protein [Bradyrhizobium sp. WYCCWR 12699]MDT4738988.1 hypothetical protein [Bradyrhizobium sp. WYCCWR 12699]
MQVLSSHRCEGVNAANLCKMDISSQGVCGQPMTVQWIEGYSRDELDRAQERFGLIFPPDLVALLREKRPVEGHDWNDDVAIRHALDLPLARLLSSIEHNPHWWPEWGERPSDIDARKEVVRDVVLRAPKLIPLIGHRYLPEEPHEAGNPVFSVFGFDTIYYGTDLDDYFERENAPSDFREPLSQFKHIRFWSDLVARYGCSLEELQKKLDR